jgi:hypothetical protein
MLEKPNPSDQMSFLMPTLNEQCDPRHRLRALTYWSEYWKGSGGSFQGRDAALVTLHQHQGGDSRSSRCNTEILENSRMLGAIQQQEWRIYEKSLL